MRISCQFLDIFDDRNKKNTAILIKKNKSVPSATFSTKSEIQSVPTISPCTTSENLAQIL